MIRFLIIRAPWGWLDSDKVKAQSVDVTLDRATISIIAFQNGQERSKRGAIKWSNEAWSVSDGLKISLQSQEKPREGNTGANYCNMYEYMTLKWWSEMCSSVIGYSSLAQCRLAVVLMVYDLGV